MLRFT